MDLIRAGLGLSKTIRNVGRLQEIVLVFARHGFDEFITNNVTAKIPNFVSKFIYHFFPNQTPLHYHVYQIPYDPSNSNF